MKKPGDKTPDPPGGRAAERLRQFEEARLPPSERDHDADDPALPPSQHPPHPKTGKKGKKDKS